MTDVSRPATPVARPTTATPLPSLEGLAPDQARAIRELARERDRLLVLQDSLRELEHSGSIDARLAVLLRGMRAIGFARAAVALQDEAGEAVHICASGAVPDAESVVRRALGDPTAWSRRLDELARFRNGASFRLDTHDAWVLRELGAVGLDASEILLLPLRRRDGRLVALLLLAGTEDGPASESLVRTAELLGRQVVLTITEATLADVARRRAERLQRLHDVGSALSRSLEEGEILRELARQVARVIDAEGIVIARPELEARRIVTLVRLVRSMPAVRPPVPLGGGPIATVARTGRPVRLTQPALAALSDDDVVGDDEPARALIAVPIMVGIQLLGVLAAYTREHEGYTDEDEEVLLTMGAQAAVALANARLYAESQRERRQSEALADVARAVNESLRLGDVLNLTLRHTSALLRAEGSCVTLQDGDDLEIVEAVGATEALRGMRLPINDSLNGRAFLTHTYVIANHASTEGVYRLADEAAGIQKAIVVPLITARGAIGTLAAINRAADFTDDDARVLQRLADHVGVAIVNARLFEEVASATREWQVAFDAIAGGMVVLDTEGRIVRSNARALQLANVTRADDLVGLPFYEGVLREHHPPSDCVIGKALVEGHTGHGTQRSMSRGKVFDVVASPHPNGGAVVTFDDVTSFHMLAERYRRVVETSRDAIVITNRAKRIEFANPAADDLFGYADGATIGMPAAELVLPELREEVARREELAFAGEPQRYETVIVRADGDRRTVAISTAPLREVGQITGVVASLRDVTEERRAPDAVTQSEARYRSLFETAPDAIFTLDKRANFTSANVATCQITGYGREELLGRSVLGLLEEEEVAGVKTHFKEALAGGAQRYECHFYRKTGDRRVASVTNTPILRGNVVVGVLAIARDLTADRAREEALVRSEARYLRLVESASDAIFTIDSDGRVTSVNRALERAIGRSRGELFGMRFIDVIEASDRDAVWSHFEATLRGERVRGEIRYRDAQDSLRVGSVTMTPIVEEGRVTGCLGIVRDMTEERTLAEQLLQREKLAAVGQLVSGVAHELNNPLAGIMAFSQLMLAMSASNPDQQDALVTIHKEAKRAAKIVSNLLIFARQRHPERTDADLNQVLQDTLELRRYSLRTHQIDVETDYDPELPLTWADAFQLQQVILNLLTNAEQALRNFGGEKRITLRTRREGELIIASIADSGPGIPPEELDQIFNPFFTTKPVGEGTGLGLSISDAIVREHGGQIRVTSKVGEGATFTVELPIVHAPVPRTGEIPVAPVRSTAPRTMLIVDDEPALRAALSLYLEREGHTVDAVASGREALEHARSRRYDAILLDLRMPDMSGDLLFEELQASDPEHAARVVFATGDADNETARSFLDQSGRPWIVKPFALEDVAELLCTEVRR
ncbi:MAG TPA: PAS domain S-box protein [Candidatus Limnocylindria bacterium]|nr:PAS domain S-box protein [Candidatus Limnocylindria bacterium]